MKDRRSKIASTDIIIQPWTDDTEVVRVARYINRNWYWYIEWTAPEWIVTSDRLVRAALASMS